MISSMRVIIVGALLTLMVISPLAAATRGLRLDLQVSHKSYDYKSDSKAKSKAKPHPKISHKSYDYKGDSKPKPKPKPHPQVPHKSYDYSHKSYGYKVVSDKCRCKKDFSDQMCAWCIGDSKKCIDESCIDKCCIIKKCKCDDYAGDVCNKCFDGDKSCPDQECSDVCCVKSDNYDYNANSGESAVPKDINTNTAAANVTETEVPPAAHSATPAMTSVASQSVSTSMGLFQVMPSVMYSFIALLAGAALAGIVIIGIRNSNDASDRSVPLTDDYVWTG